MSAPSASGSVANARIQGIRILIVEDEPFIAYDLTMAIEDAGAVAVGPAATVAEAIDFLHTERPDAVIADVHLPDGTIAAFLDAMPAGMPAVVHTGAGLPSDAKARHPDVPVFSKPTAPGILLARLAEKLGAR